MFYHILSFFISIYGDIARYAYLKYRTNPSPRILIPLILYSISPQFLPIIIYRLSHCLSSCSIPIVPSILYFLNLLLFSIEISPKTEILPGLFIPHPSGIVLGAFRIGRNATIFQSVTIGCKYPEFNFIQNNRPHLGDNVLVGSGAKVLGYLRVGDNVSIGANAVVVRDVPSNSTVIGLH